MDAQPDIVVRWRKSQCIVVFVVSVAMTLIFAGLVVYCLLQPVLVDLVLLAIVVTFFVVFTALTIWTWRWLSGDRAVVIINETGIQTASTIAKAHRLNWGQVAEIVLMEASALRRTPPMLFIVPANPSEFLKTLSLFRRTHLRFSWLVMGVKFAVVVPDGVDIPLGELAADIVAISGATLRRK